MQTNENGKERTRYPLATAFATTKYLHSFGAQEYNALGCFYRTCIWKLSVIGRAYWKKKKVYYCENTSEHHLHRKMYSLERWKIIPLSMELKKLSEEWKYLFSVAHSSSIGTNPQDKVSDCNSFSPTGSWEWRSSHGNGFSFAWGFDSSMVAAVASTFFRVYQIWGIQIFFWKQVWNMWCWRKCWYSGAVTWGSAILLLG